jgi:methyltransferase (TIGR00027 family)
MNGRTYSRRNPDASREAPALVQPGRPSGTALRVALRRAAHQLLDDPRVLDDPMALRIVGDHASALRADPGAYDRTAFDRALRAFLVARSRVAEDGLASAVAAGVRQYVVLGAGLDTFAYRNPFADLRVFEVDAPSTQTWKRSCLAAGGIDLPAGLTFVPVDFERQALTDELQRAGLRSDRPTWFSWLGVTPYLAPEAVIATLRDVVQLARDGGGVAFDYGVDSASLTLRERAVVAVLRSRVRRAGEPFKSTFKPSDLAARLAAIGFSRVVDLDARALNARYFAGRSDSLRVGSIGHVVVAHR